MSFFESHDPLFDSYVMGNAPLKRLATGFDWVEGPVWFGDANMLLFSDIPNNRILRWTPVPGAAWGMPASSSTGAGTNDGLSVYRTPSNYSNGHTRDRQGRLISCEHGSRQVTRTEHDGETTVVADAFDGKPLNSPNDVVVKSDGTIWFTDPHYGIATHYEGHKSEQQLPCNVYRVDPDSGKIHAVITDFACPNGLAFSPDETRLYVADTGRLHDPHAVQHVRVFNVDANNQIGGGEVFHVISPGCADGMRVDADGNLWSSAADGVHCIAPEGRLLGKIKVPELVSNLCFGGRAKHRLFITATTSVYSIALNRQGVQWP